MSQNIRRLRWFYLTLFCLINLFAGSYYAWSILAPAIAQRLTLLSGTVVHSNDLALVFSLASAVNPLAMIAGGWFNDRYGPRFVIAAGGLLIGTGLIAASWVTSVTALTFVYGVIFGLGVGLTYVSTISNAIKFFPDHRGLAGGLATMAYGLSSMIVPPVAGWLIAGPGIDVCLQALGGAGAAVLISAGLLTRKPSDHLSEELGLTTADSGRSTAVSLNWKAMLSTRTFWPMLLFFITGSTGAMMLFSCVASIAQNAVGLTAAAAAGAVSILALTNTVGRFAAGTVSDRIGRIPALFLSLSLAAVGFIVLLNTHAGDAVLFFAGIGLIGLCYGGYVGIYPGFTVDQFGPKYNSVNYGIMAAGFSSGGILGPMLVKWTANGHDYSACYAAALTVIAVGFVFGLLCRLWCRR